MTLLVSWVGVDSHGISSAYIAADSRVSWPHVANFDHGRKVFGFRRSPDILGYCGDVLFPTMVLSQITEMADNGLLFAADASCEERFEAIKYKVIQQFDRYPNVVSAIMTDVLQIIHISRHLTNSKLFAGWKLEWTRSSGWSYETVGFPSKSDVLFSLGSGAPEFVENMARYRKGPNAGTSRSVFHCFCDTLFNIEDKSCGGAPQLVGLDRKPSAPAINYGIIREGKRYYLGVEIDDGLVYEHVPWRNDRFERCDGSTLKKLDKAQSQPDNLRRS